jgi:DNA-binding PadR family transcriptional regulator
LIRLADRGLVEACWQDEPQPGRPRRHLYRLTTDGLAAVALAGAALAGAALAGAALADPAEPTTRPGARTRRGVPARAVP